MQSHDLSLFTESDPGSQASVSASSASLVQTGAGDASVYRSIPAYYLKGDFGYELEARLDSAATDAAACVWFASSNVGSRSAHGTNSWSFLSVEMANVSGAYRLRLSARNGATLQTATSIASVTLGATYYLRVRRAGTAFTCEICSDAARTALIETLTITLSAVAAFTHLYALNTDTSTATISLAAANLTDMRGWLVAEGGAYLGMTEVDQIGGITVGADEIVAALSYSSNGQYVYRAETVAGSFTFDVDVKIDSGEEGAALIPFMVAQGLGTDNTLRTNDVRYLDVFIRRNTGDVRPRFFILEQHGAAGTLASAAGTKLMDAFGQWYYLRVRRDTSVGTHGTFYLDIYSDPARTVLWESLSLALSENNSYSYLYGLNQYYVSSANDAISGAVRSLRKVAPAPIGSSPRQSLVEWHGEYLRAYSLAGGCPFMQHWDRAQQTLGVGQVVPFNAAHSAVSAKDLDGWYRISSGWKHGALVATSKATECPKNDNDLSGYRESIYSGAFDSLPIVSDAGICRADDDYLWACGRNSGGDLVALRMDAPNQPSAYTTKLTVEATAATNAAPQLVGFPSLDVGMLTSLDGVLAYRHYTESAGTWGGEEAVASGLAAYDDFRGVVSRSGVLTVFFRVGTELRARRRVSGAWGSEFVVTADLAGAKHGHTATADAGQPDRVVAIYFNGTDIAYREIVGGAVGSATPLVRSAEADGGWLTAHQATADRVTVAYRRPDGGIYAAWFDVAPTPVHASGTAVLSVTEPGNVPVAVIVDWPVAAVIAADNGGYSKLRLRDESTGQWLGDWASLTKRYWDHHDQLIAFSDDGGRLYSCEGARDHTPPPSGLPSPDTATIVRRSNARISSYANATALLADVTDISPPNTGAFAGYGFNRGYKHVRFGNDGTLYYIFEQSQSIHVGEYRGGVWSEPVKVVDTAADSTSYIYLLGHCVGDEVAPAQTTLHFWWGAKRAEAETPAISRGSHNLRDLNYLKLIPQGNGTFTAQRANGSSLTLPATDANTDHVITSLVPAARANSTAYALDARVSGGNGHVYRCKVAGTSGASAPAWPTGHLATVTDGTVTWEEWAHLDPDNFVGQTGGMPGWYSATMSPGNGHPAYLGVMRKKSDPEAPNDVRYWRWNGTAWEWTVLQSADFPAYTNVSLVRGGARLFVTMQKRILGVCEAVLYWTDDEAAWSMRQITSGSVSDVDMLYAYRRQDTNVFVSWFHKVHRLYGESFLTFFSADTLGIPVYFRVTIEEADGSLRSLPSSTLTIYH